MKISVFYKKKLHIIYGIPDEGPHFVYVNAAWIKLHSNFNQQEINEMVLVDTTTITESGNPDIFY